MRGFCAGKPDRHGRARASRGRRHGRPDGAPEQGRGSGVRGWRGPARGRDSARASTVRRRGAGGAGVGQGGRVPARSGSGEIGAAEEAVLTHPAAGTVLRGGRTLRGADHCGHRRRRATGAVLRALSAASGPECVRSPARRGVHPAA